jgi:hypothetical protein
VCVSVLSLFYVSMVEGQRKGEARAEVAEPERREMSLAVRFFFLPWRLPAELACGSQAEGAGNPTTGGRRKGQDHATRSSCMAQRTRYAER